MSEERIAAALRALAESDREAEAPPGVEVRVVRAFQRHRSRRLWRGAVWTAAAAAASIVAVLVWKGGHTHEALTKIPAPTVISVPSAPQVVAPVQAKPVVLKRKHKPAPAPPREVVTEFFPLIEAAPPFERGKLVRVRVPAAAMRRVGLPVNEDRLEESVQADVLVGDEGLVRAIRFVKYQQ